MYKNLTVPLNPAFAHQFLYCGFQSIWDKSDSVYFRKSMNLFVIQNIVGHVFSLLCRLRMDLVRGKILLWRWCLPWERSRSAPSRTLARSKMYPAWCRPRLTAGSCSLASGSMWVWELVPFQEHSVLDAAFPYMKTCHYLSGVLSVMIFLWFLVWRSLFCQQDCIHFLAPVVVSNNYSFYFLIDSGPFPLASWWCMRYLLYFCWGFFFSD